MTENASSIGVIVLSIVSGVSVGAQDIPGIEILDRVGMAGTAVMVVWWMLTNFSKRLDKLTEAIEKLNERTGKE